MNETLVGSLSEADLYIFSTLFDTMFDHQHVRTRLYMKRLQSTKQPTKQQNRDTYVRVPQSRSARILDPSQHPIPAHPSAYTLPQSPNRSHILTPSSPTGAIHPRSLKHASRRCFSAFHGWARFGCFYPQNATRPKCELTLAPRLFWSSRCIMHHHTDRLSHQDRKGAARKNYQTFAFTAVPLVGGLLRGAPAPCRSCVVDGSTATVPLTVSRPSHEPGP